MIESIPFYVWFILGVFIGGFVGLITFGLMVISGETNVESELSLTEQALIEKESDLHIAEIQLTKLERIIRIKNLSIEKFAEENANLKDSIKYYKIGLEDGNEERTFTTTAI